jgi:hypothetical protein
LTAPPESCLRPGSGRGLVVPTTDTKVRPRANGYRNEGSTTQFVLCGMGGYPHDELHIVYFYVSSTDGQEHSMRCTAVTGLVGWQGPIYSTKAVTVPTSGYGYVGWYSEDFGGNEGESIPAGAFNFSVTCNLPPGAALQGMNAYTD